MHPEYPGTVLLLVGKNRYWYWIQHQYPFIINLFCIWVSRSGKPNPRICKSFHHQKLLVLIRQQQILTCLVSDLRETIFDCKGIPVLNRILHKLGEQK